MKEQGLDAIIFRGSAMKRSEKNEILRNEEAERKDKRPTTSHENGAAGGTDPIH